MLVVKSVHDASDVCVRVLREELLQFFEADRFLQVAQELAEVFVVAQVDFLLCRRDLALPVRLLVG